MRAQILSVGHALPERRLTNQELEQMVDTSDEWIIERSGIRERRIADQQTKCSDLAYQASKMALERAGLSAQQLDLIIVATATPDMFFPSTACIVQDLLGATNAAAFDLSAGCTGFVYALDVAHKYLLSEDYQHVLVIGAETLSRILDYRDRNTCVLFGDGAGAAVMGKGTSDYGILSSILGADGSGGKFLNLPAGGSAMPASPETIQNRLHYLKMNGPEVFRFATRITSEISTRVLEKAGFAYSDVDLFVPHQANMRIIKTAMKRMNIPAEKTLINLDMYGNTSAACIPIGLSLAQEEGRLKAGDLVLMVAFGAGLTFGGVLLRWGRG
ncbi:MAG TPA: 3-oxoacyl-ACP synthase [Syntrophomonas sp.]|nr:3-oxoacyl-ACP synthase [Syntrophomonas sp.]